jgi:hypothetical protein
LKSVSEIKEEVLRELSKRQMDRDFIFQFESYISQALDAVQQATEAEVIAKIRNFKPTEAQMEFIQNKDGAYAYGWTLGILEYFLTLSPTETQVKKEEMNMSIDKKALEIASAKLRRLRLTNVFGEKDIPQETVQSVFKTGLGGMYDDKAITYVLEFGIKYYLESLDSPSTKGAGKKGKE